MRLVMMAAAAVFAASAAHAQTYPDKPIHIVVPFSPGTTTSPSMIADPAATCQASSAIFRKRLVQSWPRRVKIFTASFARCTWTR